MTEEVKKPWGSYKVLRSGPKRKLKEIFVFPGKRLSLQYHKHRSEKWEIVKGEARVEVGDKVVNMKEKDTLDIPKGVSHRVTNVGKEMLVILEVQLGDVVEEWDIVRLEDDYGRVKNLELLNEMRKKYPNNMEFGKNVREFLVKLFKD